MKYWELASSYFVPVFVLLLLLSSSLFGNLGLMEKLFPAINQAQTIVVSSAPSKSTSLQTPDRVDFYDGVSVAGNEESQNSNTNSSNSLTLRTANGYWGDTEEFGQESSINEARRAYQQALTQGTNHALDKAEQAARHLLSRGDSNSEAYNLLGLIYVQRGNYQAAISNFEKGLTIDRTNMNSYINLALAYQKIGNKEQAEKTYYRSLEVKPEHQFALYNLGVLLMNQKKIIDASAAFQRLLQLEPGHTKALINLSVLKLQQKKLQHSEKLLLRAKKLRPDYWKCYYNMSLLKAAQDEIDDAIHNLKRTIELKPDYQPAR
ncbi:MAG: tetratricopeptide repeat protein, partial [Aliifodinibius sp.]|nr:tetratricopeptide repeat protein [Fodinibius sp.]NIV16385.1 tetratricopeptide repeat protein [Fodinibius sp.]NIY30359.1 tetratricopeptide repeat protein [Fodinibius sp.]